MILTGQEGCFKLKCISSCQKCSGVINMAIEEQFLFYYTF